MTTATLKEITKKLGVAQDDLVNFYEEGDNGIIKVDLKKNRDKNKVEKEAPDVFDNILSISQDVGIKDWSLNHDHYLYGTPKRDKEKID